MAPVTNRRPTNSDLSVRMDGKGRMAVYFKGERLPGVMKIESTQECGGLRSQFRVTFIGCVVKLETENV